MRRSITHGMNGADLQPLECRYEAEHGGTA
jgi:hypothetical protein